MFHHHPARSLPLEAFGLDVVFATLPAVGSHFPLCPTAPSVSDAGRMILRAGLALSAPVVVTGGGKQTTNTPTIWSDGFLSPCKPCAVPLRHIRQQTASRQTLSPHQRAGRLTGAKPNICGKRLSEGSLASPAGRGAPRRSLLGGEEGAAVCLNQSHRCEVAAANVYGACAHFLQSCVNCRKMMGANRLL